MTHLVYPRIMYRVFLYGTLKRGQPNHGLLNDTKNGISVFIGDGSTEKTYPLIIASSYNLPFMLHVEGEGQIVHGEVFDVNESMLKRLDSLEHHPHFYRRQEIEVIVGDEKFQCHSYFLHNFKPELMSLPNMNTYDNDSLPESKKHARPPDARVMLEVKHPDDTSTKEFVEYKKW